MATATFYTLTKRKNSTLQPTGSGTDYDVNLKSGTSFISPTFLLNYSGQPTFNYAHFEGRYYFVNDITQIRNDLWEISTLVDVLATYKADILASTQFVSYSSSSTSSWLADTRIPLQKNATVSSNTSSMGALFTSGGFYVLSVVGKTGCDLWACDSTHIARILDRVNNWKDDIYDDVFTNHTYQWDASDLGVNFENLSKIITRSGAVGNAYSDAPACIRSCIWVPFFAANFAGSSGVINLGQFDTGVTTFKCIPTAYSSATSVSIPWQFSDWRRAICEEVYLYLPLVGMISIPSDEIVGQSSITVEWSATATDGCVAYRVVSGSQVIGTYGSNCSVNYPIGVSQQASAGEIVQSLISGIQKTVSAGVSSSMSPISMAAAEFSTVATGVVAAYDTLNVANTAHNSCIGGIGGGAGVGLSLDLKCFTVAHPTVIPPADMKDTMGLPTMKPMALSTLTGYCQCSNAHVSAAATSTELDAIDRYINSGFYIE